MNHAIILLACKGSIFDTEIDKNLLKINDKYMCQYIIETLLTVEEINNIVLVVNQANLGVFKEMVNTIKPSKPVSVIAGDEVYRQKSLALGFKSIQVNPDDVIVTLDGDRPFVTNKLISKSIEMAKAKGFCSASLPVNDAIIKFTSYEDRKSLTRLQTPQYFIAKHFNEHFELEKPDLISCMGWKLKTENLFPGDPLNFKITTKFDYNVAKKIKV